MTEFETQTVILSCMASLAMVGMAFAHRRREKSGAFEEESTIELWLYKFCVACVIGAAFISTGAFVVGVSDRSLAIGSLGIVEAIAIFLSYRYVLRPSHLAAQTS